MTYAQFLNSIAGVLTEGINVACIVMILSELPAALSVPREQRSAALAKALRFILVTLIAMAVPIFLAETSKENEFWPGHPGFPSGHTTFTASACAAIAVYRGSWWWLLGIPLTLLMMVSLVIRHYHNPPEVFGGMVLGIGLSTVITRLLIRPNVPEPVSVPVQE